MHNRYEELHQECFNQGVDVTYKWPNYQFDEALWNDYVVTQEDIKLNQKRILERMPEKARFYGDPL